jgi:hypothetical protein
VTAADPALEAAADRHTAETLDMLRAMAGTPEFAQLSQHAAAVRLAGMLIDTVDAESLANTLANVLIQQVRREDLPPAITTTQAAADPNNVRPRPNMSEDDRKLNIESRLLSVVSSYGGQRLVADNPAMPRLVADLASEAENLAAEGYLTPPESKDANDAR